MNVAAKVRQEFSNSFPWIKDGATEMDFDAPIVEEDAQQFLQKFESSSLEHTDKLFEWLLRVANSSDSLFDLSMPIITTVLQLADLDSKLLLNCLEVLRKNSFRCKGKVSEYFVTVAVLCHMKREENLISEAESLLNSVRASIYSDEATLSLIIEVLRTNLVPKMKSLADSKEFLQALALWRSVVKFTRFEKIPTTVTNKILLVATIAFKETDFQVHIEAFDSWKALIAALPQQTLKKTNYITLLLNPLNRFYRDTDAVISPYKFSAWWQLVVSLESHIDSIFDTVVVPLLQKVFTIPSAKGRSSMPSVFASPTRQVSQVAYVILALILYDGDSEILKEVSTLHDKLPVNRHCIGSKCFTEQVSLFEEVLNLIYHNITQQVSPPPKIYPYILVKVLLSRISSLHEIGCDVLSRLFLVNVFKYLNLKSFFDSEQLLSIYTDIGNKLPQKLLISTQISLKDGTALPEAPLTSFVALYVDLASQQGSEKSRKRQKTLFKTLVQRATSEMNFLQFVERILSSLNTADISDHSSTWSDTAERIIEVVNTSHEINQGSASKHNFDALIGALRFPFKKSFHLTADIIKTWSKLFSVFSIEATLVKDVETNQHIEELCLALFEELSLTEFDLNRLMLCSQAFESIVKQVCFSEPSPKAFVKLDSLMKCLSLIFTKGSEYISNESEQTANCQYFVNLVQIVNYFIQNSQNLEQCQEILVCLTPYVIPLIEVSRTKSLIKETALASVEGPLTIALSVFSELFVVKVQKISPENTRLSAIVRTVIEKSSNHWKRSIRDPICSFAKSQSVPIVLDQTLSQIVEIEDAVVPLQTAKVQAQRASTPKRRNSQRKAPEKKPDDDDEFTPIKSSKKKTIFTEHQLEKQAELKIIPSLYQDLSQSVDKNITEPQDQAPVADIISTDTIEPTKNAPVMDEDAVFQDITPKKEEKIEEAVPVPDNDQNQESEKTTSKARRSLAGKDVELEGIKPFEAEAIDENDPNTENGEPAPKKKKRFSYSEAEDLCEPVPHLQDPPSVLKMAEKIQERLEKTEEIIESPIRTIGARKRKLSINIDSPVNSKLQQRGFLHNSPSSRSRKMLEAAQARYSMNPVTDARFMMAGFTPRHNNTVSIFQDNSYSTTPKILEERQINHRVTFAIPSIPSPSVTRRSILKRASNGPSSKRVSFSRSNEVCSFEKNSRLSTSESLNPPIIVRDVNGSADETSDNEDQSEKSFHEQLVKEASEIESESKRVLEESFHSAEENQTDEKHENGDDEPQFSSTNRCISDGSPPMPLNENNASTRKTVNLREIIESANEAERVDMFEFLSSNEFLSLMNPTERSSFVSRLFGCVSSYVH